MPKYSIVIPVYNVEKYIKRCLDSVFNQTEKDFEVIVINDGTKDNSMDIVKKYDVVIINQKNLGLSEARNNGVKKAKGEYLIFLDSDDYWDKDLLKNISKSLDNKPDLVRFQVQEVFEESDKKNKYEEKVFFSKSGETAFNIISSYHFVENAWCYAIKREYYLKERFEFKKGMMHEDFGLMPLIILKASCVNSISYVGYNYFQRNGSIMSDLNYDKTKKKVSDFYNQYLSLINDVDKTKLNKEVFKSFCANSVILKICELKNPEYKEYKNKLKKDKVFDNLLTNTFSRKIKKVMYKISPKMTAKFIK